MVCLGALRVRKQRCSICVSRIVTRPLKGGREDRVLTGSLAFSSRAAGRVPGLETWWEADRRCCAHRAAAAGCHGGAPL